MTPRTLSAVFFAALCPAPLEAAEPPQRPEKLMVRTLHDGVVPYTVHPSGCYVRADPEADKRMKYNREFSERELGPFTRTPEVAALHRAVRVRVGSDPSPEEVWEAVRCILGWHWAHSRYDPDQYDVLSRAGWPRKDGIRSFPSRRVSVRHTWFFSSSASAACPRRTSASPRPTT